MNQTQLLQKIQALLKQEEKNFSFKKDIRYLIESDFQQAAKIELLKEMLLKTKEEEVATVLQNFVQRSQHRLLCGEGIKTIQGLPGLYDKLRLLAIIDLIEEFELLLKDFEETKGKTEHPFNLPILAEPYREPINDILCALEEEGYSVYFQELEDEDPFDTKIVWEIQHRETKETNQLVLEGVYGWYLAFQRSKDSAFIPIEDITFWICDRFGATDLEEYFDASLRTEKGRLFTVHETNVVDELWLLTMPQLRAIAKQYYWYNSKLKKQELIYQLCQHWTEEKFAIHEVTSIVASEKDCQVETTKLNSKSIKKLPSGLKKYESIAAPVIDFIADFYNMELAKSGKDIIGWYLTDKDTGNKALLWLKTGFEWEITPLLTDDSLSEEFPEDIHDWLACNDIYLDELYEQLA